MLDGKQIEKSDYIKSLIQLISQKDKTEISILVYNKIKFSSSERNSADRTRSENEENKEYFTIF